MSNIMVQHDNLHILTFITIFFERFNMELQWKKKWNIGLMNSVHMVFHDFRA